MFAASLKRFNNLTNIGMKPKDQSVKPTDCDLVYMDPAHVCYVEIIHATTDFDKRSFVGTEERAVNAEIPFPQDAAVVHVDVEYLKAIVDNLAPKTTVKLTLGTDYPLKIEGLLDASANVKAFIAPRIENE